MGVQQPVSAAESFRLEGSDGEATGFPLAPTDVQNAPGQERGEPREFLLPLRARCIRQRSSSNFAAKYRGHMTKATR